MLWISAVCQQQSHLVSVLVGRNEQCLFISSDMRTLTDQVFDRRHVALMPGIRWLPAAGVDVGRDDRRERPADYSSID